MNLGPPVWLMEESGAPPGSAPPPAPRFGAPPPPPPEGPPRDGPRWEKRRGPLDLAALFGTVGQVLLDAPATFRGMVRDAGLGGPLLFMVIFGTLGSWISLAWQMAIPSPDLGTGGSPILEILSSPSYRLASFLMAPVWVLAVFFIWSGFVHLTLLLLGGARQPYETTARVIAYVSGSTAVFQIIPVCGVFIGLVWAWVVQIIGLARAHETGTGMAAAAVLLPVAFCCLLLFGLMLVFAAVFSRLIGGGL
ncbi:MAG: YIP1 family protein [Acidobacteriota bacterium]